MNIKRPCNLAKWNAGPHHPILATSPDYIFMDALCRGDAELAVSVFAEKRLFTTQKPAVDSPYGRFEGLEEIRKFAKEFPERFHAQSARLVPVVQTIANGRVGLELEVHFEIDGEIEQIPMFLVADFGLPNKLEEIRLYCHAAYIPGVQAYRRPMFESAHLEMGDPGLLTGAVREYYEALHYVPGVDVERMRHCVDPDCIVGGYSPHDGEKDISEAKHTEGFFQGLASYIPRCLGMRYETIVDDGKTCIIEWQHIMCKAGIEERNRVAMAGVSAYERGANGKLCSIRICDYAGFENTIDWEAVGITREEAAKVNYVDTFPAGVGRKKQTDWASRNSTIE